MGGTSEATGGRSSRLGKAVALAVLVLSCAAAYWLQSGWRVQGRDTDCLWVPPEALNIGTVWETDRFEWTLPITNRSKETITVSQFIGTCNCTEIEPPSITVKPGDTVSPKVNLNLTYSDQDLMPRDFNIRIEPIFVHRFAFQRHDWRLRGTVKKAICFSPFPVIFRESLVKSSKFPTAKVSATSAVRLQNLEIAVSPNVLDVAFQFSPTSRKEFQLKITPSQTIPPGALDCKITCIPVTYDGNKLPPVRLPVKGHVFDDIRVIPDNLLFGVVQLGTHVTETVRVLSSSGEHFEIKSMRMPTDTSIEPIDSDLDNIKLFRITQPITKVGYQYDDVEFIIRRESGLHSIVSLRIRYYGTSKLN